MAIQQHGLFHACLFRRFYFSGRILFVDVTPYTPPFSPRSGLVPGEILFQLHPTKCKELIISFKKQPARFDSLEKKIVGVAFRDDLKWTNHVDTINSTLKDSCN